jgi:5-methylthioadenosine/S-adenosylhomocysteine deaminase
VTATTGILRADLMDLLLRGGTLVTCDPEDRVTAGDLWISAGRIAAVGTDAAARARASRRALRVLDVEGCAVVPGFVQAHVHLCQTLFRGMADDLPLLGWLQQRIWPLEAAHDPASLRASADLGIAELIKGGTTTVLDMGTVRHHDAVFEALRDAGLRAVSGKTMMDGGASVPAGLRETTQESLDEADALCARWHGAAGGRLRYAYSPRFILSCTEGLFRGCVERARARGALLHTHASEHRGEREAVRAALGMDDVDALRAWGFAGPDVVVAHGVILTPKQRRYMGRDQTRVAHCPSANLKLGSGVARVAAMHRAGIVVGIGADGAACNNNLDALLEMRLASLLALADEVGSIELGKRADVTVIDVSATHIEPWGEAATRIVYAAQSRDVRHVVVDGRVLLHDGRLTTLDEDDVRERARAQAVAVRARAGITS